MKRYYLVTLALLAIVVAALYYLDSDESSSAPTAQPAETGLRLN